MTDDLLTEQHEPCVQKHAGYTQKDTVQWRRQQFQAFEDFVVEEKPVAFVYNGISQAVMMATPCDLEDFAIGFSLTEGIIDSRDQIYDLQIAEEPNGFQIDLQISSEKMQALKQYRRSLVGNTGCGLCGVESLNAALRKGREVKTAPLPEPEAIHKAVDAINSWQHIQHFTGACHAAAWCDWQGNKVLLREDVGRHNAFDKLIGAMTEQKIDAEQGFALISSRASYEMVHKASFLQCANLVAVSAPTSLAIEQASLLNINLIGFARNGKHNIYNSSQD
jgi:FdhD protein